MKACRELWSLWGVGMICVLGVMAVLGFIMIAIAFGLSPRGWIGVAIPSAIATLIFIFIAAAIAHMAGKLPLFPDD